MKKVGFYLLLFIVGSMILNLINYEFRILMWIDNWGKAVGWTIRIGLAVAGAILFFIGKSKGEAQPASVENQPEKTTV